MYQGAVKNQHRGNSLAKIKSSQLTRHLILQHTRASNQMNDIMDSQKVHAKQKLCGHDLKQRWFGQTTAEQYGPQSGKCPHSQNMVMFKSSVCCYCGKSHAREDKCPAPGAEFYCHKMRHFSNICL